MSAIEQIFETSTTDEAGLAKLAETPVPAVRYVIAMTPRSGSSHLCDVIKSTFRLGRPGEFLAAEFIPGIMRKIPSRNSDEYFQNVFKGTQTKNGVAGLKASWFQFNRFRATLKNKAAVRGPQYIYLSRRDIYAQAVSLYKATASGVFHTNISHQAESKDKLSNLQYSFDEIHKWYLHIVAQEEGWERFFERAGIQPLHITYEQIDRDVSAIVSRIGRFMKLPAFKPVEPEKSIFKKVSDQRNLEWARQFAIEVDRATLASEASET